MTKKQKNMLARIIAASVLYAVSLILEARGVFTETGFLAAALLAFMIPYLTIGWDIVYKAFRGIAGGQVFDENFLMTLATFGAFGVGEYSEAVAVMLFYQVGELFQNYAVTRSRQSIADLMDICPEYANIEEDGRIKQVEPDDVAVGDIIIVKAGERIPLDGVVVDGESMVDTSALTGESVPRRAEAGSEIISGCVNGSGVLRIRVTREFDDSTVARILELVENASSKKAQVENFITRFARYYTPAVVCAALCLALVPPLLLGGGFGEWLKRACIFLVISCPCALVISVPLSFFGGIGAASKRGVLVKGSNYLEALAEMETIVFDKTGTLTKGEFKVTQIRPEGMGEEELLELAALAELYSTHPIAESVRESCRSAGLGDRLNAERVGDAKELSGQGIRARIDGHEILAGNGKLMEEFQIPYQECRDIGTVIYLAKDGAFAGSILIADSVKEEAGEAIRRLKACGVRKTVMLTGDRRAAGEAVASRLGIDEAFTELLPAGKVEKVEELLAQMSGKSRLAFVGDGINDAPVLSRADIGIAMGSMGSDAAIEAADIVLMDDNPAKIAAVVNIARKTLSIVRQNIIFALAVKALVLLFGALGLANMWEAVFADVGVSVIAILNAMRTLRIKE
ncbi:MAG: cadmium-translocating P-type ATPase [Clostridium sp.]|nr:cadmium-translocating P-type ATPase [Clostridium sp.]